MIKKHEYNNTIVKFTDEELTQVISDLNNNLNRCLSLIELGEQFENGTIDELDYVDMLEDCILSEECKFKEYAHSASSRNDSINRLMKKLACLIEGKDELDKEVSRKSDIVYLNEQIGLAIDNSIVDESDVANLTLLGELVCKEIVHILFYEFGVYNLLLTFKETGDLEESEIDSALEQYCSKKSIDIIEETKRIASLASVYKTQLPIFDSYPELESEFENIVGPYISDLSDVEDQLTIDIVKKVITGEIQPDRLLEYLS